MDKTKKFIKELKRIRWPNSKDGVKTFFVIMIFIALTSLALFGVSILFTTLWDGIGAGING